MYQIFKKQINVIFKLNYDFFAAISYFALKHITKIHDKNIFIFAIVRDVFAKKNNYLFNQRFVALTLIGYKNFRITIYIAKEQ